MEVYVLELVGNYKYDEEAVDIVGVYSTKELAKFAQVSTKKAYQHAYTRISRAVVLDETVIYS